MNLGAAAGDLSIWGLFVQADIVVKLVMVLLVFASVWVWAIVFEKVTSLRRANRAADAFEDRFWSGGSLDELLRRRGHQARASDGRGVRRGHERMAPQRRAWPAPMSAAAACATASSAP